MHIVVIGHGMVGHKFIETLAASGRTDLRVTVLGEEPRPAYDRVHLSAFFAGKSADELSLVAPGFFDAILSHRLKPAPGPSQGRGGGNISPGTVEHVW